MSNSSLGHKKQKIQYMKFTQCFVLEIKFKLTKVIDLLYRGHVGLISMRMGSNLLDL